MPNGVGTSSVDSPTPREGRKQQAACLTCREAKQKCSKGVPCQRCLTNRLQCQYPLKSNRGRKRGSTNKPDTAEKVLSRLKNSSFRGEVIAALSANAEGPSPSPITPTTASQPSPQNVNEQLKPHHDKVVGYLDCHQPAYSPLEILAAAVALKKHPTAADSASLQASLPRNDTIGSSSQLAMESMSASPEALASEKAVELYFTPRTQEQTDWQVLALQPADSTLQLQSSLHDPINSRLVDSDDALLYFDLFYQYRNPWVGLLDPLLHTPKFVRSASFTLFSVICALGCAMSNRARDKLLCSALVALAEGNIKWSIAASVRTVETIQAIINMTYWAPLSERQCDDPYWLRLTHAAQTAREMGINRHDVILQKVDAIPGLSDESRERRLRNYERTWLYVFIADKSFGIATGRPMCVSWRELMPDVGNWWRNRGTTPADRLICGVAAMRLIVVKAFEARQASTRTKASILMWQNENFAAVSHLRISRCSYADASAPPDCPANSILSFYLDYSLVLVNSYALRDLIGLGMVEDLTELTAIYQRSLEVIDRMMDLILFDSSICKLMIGIINPQLVMLCHIATEVIQAAKQGTPHDCVTQVAMKMRMLVNSLEDMKRALPGTSWVSLYTTLYKTFVTQLDQVLDKDMAPVSTSFDDKALTGWWDPIDGGLLDLSNWLDADASGLDGSS